MLEESLIQKLLTKLKVAIINVKTWDARNAEVTETVGRRIDIVAVQKACYRNYGDKTLRGGCFN